MGTVEGQGEEASIEIAEVLSTETNGTLLKHTCLGLRSRDPNSVGPRWNLQICISTKAPGDADLLVQGPTLSSLFWEALEI